MDNKKLLVVVPVYNEADKIRNTVKGLKTIDLIDEVLIVNDGSTDNTAEIIEKLDVSIISMEKNQGKGYAMKKAMEEMDYDYIAFVDGDLELTSSEVGKLIHPVIADEVDFTIAQFPKRSTKTDTKGGFGIVKGLAKKGVYFFTKKEIDTTLSGQRIYKKEVIKSIKYIPSHYGIEIAMTIQAINNGYTFKEIPVNMSHRYSDRSIKGIIHRGKQFFDILRTLIVMYFRR